MRRASGERRVEVGDHALDRGVELVGGDDLGDEAPGERVGGGDALAAHDHVLRAAEADEPGEPLRPAGAGDHPEPDLGEAELRVVGGDAEVAGERELEADAEAVAADARDHRLRETLGGGDVPGQVREMLRGRRP